MLLFCSAFSVDFYAKRQLISKEGEADFLAVNVFLIDYGLFSLLFFTTIFIAVRDSEGNKGYMGDGFQPGRELGNGKYVYYGMEIGKRGLVMPRPIC